MSKKKDKDIIKDMCENASVLLAYLRAKKEIDKRKKQKETKSKEKQL